MTSLPALAIASGLWACGPGLETRSAGPEPGLIVQVYETSYDVRGTTIAAVDSSLRSRRPPRGDGVSVAEVDWEARLNYRTRERLDGCRLERVRVELVFTVILPHLTTSLDTGSELASSWERFLGAIKFHESGHREITIQQAAELVRHLKKLRARTCTELRRRVVLARDRFFVTATRLNQDYDVRTDHGRRDGVRWPPSPD